MKRFDKRLKRQLKQATPKISVQAETAFDKTIDKIREDNLKRKPQRLMQPMPALAALCAVFLVLAFLNLKTGRLDGERNEIAEPNICSEASATGNRETAQEPQIEEIESIRVGMIDYHNPEIRQFTEMILTQLKKDRKESQKNLDVDYEIITNTEQWFVLRVIAKEEKGETVYYYNVDKKSCRIVQLSDLFVGGFDYTEVFSEEIKAQINSEIEGDYYKIDRNQEFYFNQKGNLVLVFRKKEAAPEEIGWIWFVIEKEVFEKALK